MTRIIAGTAGGRRIETPQGERTRPTTDRIREALFSALESWCGSLQDLRFLDLYAGSGAVGLEAWSRGAGAVTLVESDARTAALIATNARTLGATGVDVRTATVAATLRHPPTTTDDTYDVVFSDPPYTLSDDDLAADLLALEDWLADDALVIVERGRRSREPVWPPRIVGDRTKRYGDTVLWYGRAAPRSSVGRPDQNEE